jgi:hypothetical protein
MHGPINIKLIGFYNQDEKCLLRGTDCVFKYSSLRFVFKALLAFHILLDGVIYIEF